MLSPTSFKTIVSGQAALQDISSHGEHHPTWQDLVAHFGVDGVCLGHLVSIKRRYGIMKAYLFYFKWGLRA